MADSWRQEKFPQLYTKSFLENPGQQRNAAYGWRQLASMLDVVHGNLTQYKKGLEAGWDSDGGRKFVEQVTLLIGTIGKAKELATARASVLDKAAEHSQWMRDEMNKIRKGFDEHVKYWNDLETREGGGSGFMGFVNDVGDMIDDGVRNTANFVRNNLDFGLLDDRRTDLQQFITQAHKVLDDLDDKYNSGNTTLPVPKYQGPEIAIPLMPPLPSLNGPGRVAPKISARPPVRPPVQPPPTKPTPPPVVPPPVDKPYVPPPDRPKGPVLTGKPTTLPPTTPHLPPPGTGVLRPPSTLPPTFPGPGPGVLKPPGEFTRPSGPPTSPPGPQSGKPGATKPVSPPGGPGSKSTPQGAPPASGRKTGKGGPKDPLAGDEARRPGMPPAAGGRRGKTAPPDADGHGLRPGTSGGRRGRTAPPDADGHGLRPGTSGRATPPTGRRTDRTATGPDLDHDALGKQGSGRPVIGNRPKPGWGQPGYVDDADDLAARRPGPAAKGVSSGVLRGNPAKGRIADQDDLVPRGRRTETEETLLEEYAEAAAPPVIDTPTETRPGPAERGPVIGGAH